MSSSATTWSCNIKLRFDYDSSGLEAVEQKEVVFGPTITDKYELDVWLRRAQAGILNPNIPPEFFHNKSAQDLKNFSSTNSLKFSRNVVSIFIEDPGATDLSFVDLPGLIQNEEQEVVDLVRELTESYINRSNTIILTTIPMSDDMQNQQSVKLARDADPEGERTIGILTKPDTLVDGAVNARKGWVDVIEGREHRLKHGYYCVRLPDDAQRAQHLSRAALQRMASDYFDTTSPWKEIDNRGRFGIPAFVTDISILLVKHIKRVIPQLTQDVERLLASCLQEIDALPRPLETDPQIEVLTRVNAFCAAFRGVVSGASSDKELAQRNRTLYARFAKEIRGTAPDFRPFESPERYQRIDVLDSEERCEAQGHKGKHKPIRIEVLDFEGRSVQDHRVKTLGVYEVRKTITDSIAWELPGNIPFEAKTRLINQFTTLWRSPAERCLISINDVLDDIIQKLAEKHFGRFNVLHDLILDLILPDIEEHKNRTQDAVKATLDLEITPTYTQNLQDFENLRGRWLARYRRARRSPGEYLIPPPSTEKKGSGCAKGLNASWDDVESAEQRALEYLAQAGYKGLTVDDLTRLLPRDHFEDELIVMADVRAYFTIAYKRIIDHVFLKIEHILHQALAERLSVSLLQRLLADTNSSGNSDDRMRELVSEDPTTGMKRTQLEASRTRLQEMRRKLVNFSA